ncbi:MAG: hypothetical protein KGZ31_02355 [Sulfuritalea sp.]|nr:hypothetical protein [Sulfuritalea sp.]
MSKLLLLLFLGLLAYLVFKGFQRAAVRRERSEERLRSPERMVACAHCGVNLPESEAVEDAGRQFCSEEHRQLGAHD